MAQTSPERGFTLIELAIVLVLMGLIAALAVPRLWQFGSDLKDEALAFAAIARHAADESILTGTPVGVVIAERGYSVMRLRRGVWQPLEEGPFRRQSWSDNLSISLKLGGGAVGRLSDAQPAIVFSAVGEATPFELAFRRGSDSITVTGGPDGHLDIVPGQDG